MVGNKQDQLDALQRAEFLLEEAGRRIRESVAAFESVAHFNERLANNASGAHLHLSKMRHILLDKKSKLKTDNEDN